MTQHAFYFDQSRCSGCRTCSVACKNWHGLPPGPLKYARVYEYEKGNFPNVRLQYYWIPCYHCEKPACVDVCPNGAMRKEERFGAVLIDGDKCDGCRLCYDECPYGAVVFESDALSAKARKCTMCVDRLEAGDLPICVLACPSRALDFGLMERIIARYGECRQLEEMPDSVRTRPSLIVKPSQPKRDIVPYDGAKALRLLARRDPLPSLYASSDDVTTAPPGTVGRDDLVIKHSSAAELMRRTRNDEG